MLFAAFLLFSTAAPAPLSGATAIGTAHARIVRPVQVKRSGESVGSGASANRLVTHQRPRRDGAAVVDCY